MGFSNAINRLTGDVIAGPGSGSQATTLVLTANVQDLIDDEIENLVIPANGYGITGNTGLTPTPAVGLTSSTSHNIQVSVPTTSAVTIFTSASLPIGTYLFVGGTTFVLASALESSVEESIGVGTATATFEGKTGGAVTIGVIDAIHYYNNQGDVALSGIVTVTAPGTVIVTARAITNAAAASAQTGEYNVGNTNAYTFVRIS